MPEQKRKNAKLEGTVRAVGELSFCGVRFYPCRSGLSNPMFFVTSCIRFWGNDAVPELVVKESDAILMQGDYYSYAPMGGSDVNLLNRDKTYNITYKDFITGPLPKQLQTHGSFGVDSVTGNGHVSMLVKDVQFSNMPLVLNS